MATFNLTTEAPSVRLLDPDDSLGQEDILVLGRDDDAMPGYQAIGFEPEDRVDLREFPDLTAAQILASANELANNVGVRFETPFFTLTLGGVTLGQLSEENFVFTNPPIAVADATTIAEGGTAVISVLANDSDPDGDSFSITGVTEPGNGTVAISGDTLVYNPTEATFSGIDSFNYTITDSTGETGTASVTVTVGGNLPPDAVADTVQAIAEISTTIDVLANDTDPDGDTLSIASVTNGANGTVSIVDSVVVYTPNEATFTGTDSFSYTITDGNEGTDWATVNVTVVDNLNPIANPDNTTIAVGATASISVLENDSDPNGQALMINGVSNPLNGTAVIDGDQIIYTPGTTPGGDPFGGVDTFFYTIGDGNGGTASSMVTVTVGGPQPPLAVDDSAVTALASAVNIDVLANDTDADGDSLSISGLGTGTANGGTLSLSGNGVVYTPDVTFSGTDSFTYTVSDGALTDTAAVSVQVGGQVPPIAVSDTVTSVEGAVVTVPVLANDTDPNQDTLSITGIGTPVGGTASIIGEQVVYTPNADFTGTENISYTITDGNENFATARIYVTVDRNEPPIANPDFTTIEPLSTTTIAVLDNDSDPDGQVLSITGIGTPDNGTVQQLGTQISYVPNDASQTPNGQAFAGTDSFIYSITDGTSTVSTSVRVTVGGNQPPVAENDEAGTAIGTAVAIDVLANDTDPEGNTITIFGAGNGASGTTSIGNNQITYTPTDANFTGTDSFVYTVSDGNGGVDTATVTVQVGDLPPVANNDTATLVAGQAAITIGVLANDSDPDGGSFTLTGVSTPGQGSARIFDNGTPDNPGDDFAIYEPNSSFTTTGGTDSFTYTITNNDGRTDTATVTVLANQPPIATNDRSTIQTLATATIAVLDNDSDPDGDSVQILGVSSPDNGTATVIDNQVIYEPGIALDGQPFSGTESFTYSITDGGGGVDTATISVVVGGNQPPIAVNDTFTLTEGASNTIDVVANDLDPDGNALRLEAVGQGSNGSVSIVNNQAVYTASSTTFTGTDTFVYTITDSNASESSSTATVLVNIVANEAPVANPDSATILSGGTTTISVLANDSDPNPTDVLTVTGAGNTTNGTSTLSNNQVIFQATNSTFVGAESFTYTISDGNGGTATSTVTVNIGGNQPPVGVDDTASVTSVSTVTIDVLTNDSDPNTTDTLSIAGVGNGSNGIAIQIGNQIQYIPSNSTFTGTDSFVYTVTDNQGGSDTATVTVNIGPNQLPTPVNDATTIASGATATIDVLANDSDPDGDSVQLVGTAVSTPDNGTATIVGNEVIYTPTLSTFVGTDSFVYSVTDGVGGTSSASVIVTVGGNQPPVGVNDTVTTLSGGTATISVLANDSDLNSGDTLSITGVSTPANGSVSIFNNGTAADSSDDQVVYTPSNTTFTGTDSFTYSITDGQGGNGSATVSVIVEGNQGPTAVNDTETVPVLGSSTINVLSNDSDPNTGIGDTLSVIGVGGNAPGLGSLTLVNGNVIYTPNSSLGVSFTGSDAFTYTIQDQTGLTSAATVALTIGGFQPPMAANDTAITSQGFATTISVLANDTDIDGGTLSIVGVSTPANGTVSINDNGTTNTTADDVVVYTPNSTFVGTDTFTYSISDSQGTSGGTDSAQVVVTVGNNLSPTANNDSETISVTGSSTINVLANDTDPNTGDVLSVTGAGGNNTSFGSVTVTNGQVIYTPSSGLNTSFAGTDTFTYTIQDAAGATDSATVTLTIGGNQPPVAGTDSATVIEAVTTTIAVLANDSDPDSSPNGGTLSITGVGTATNGTVTINDNGTPTISSDDVVIYTTTNGTFTGTDSFVYSITDGDGTSGSTVSGTVNLTVNQNLAPVANADTATVSATGSSTIDVTSNDSDPNSSVGDILSVTGVGSQTNTSAGTVAVSNGQVIYTSAISSTATANDSFTYTVSDLSGNTATTTVSVTVGGPQPPIANADSVTVNQSSTTTIAGLTSNDSDPNGDTFSIVGVTAPTNGGTASVNATGEVIYTATSATGTDTFTYSIADGTGTSSATVTVNIDPSQAPIAVNDTTTIQQANTATIAVLANDSDPDGDTLQLVANSLSTPTNGTASISGDNVIYTPNTIFAGVDRFTYDVTDGFGGTASATVQVMVGGNQPPDAVNDTFSVVQAITNTIAVLANDTDVDSGTLSITGVSTATNGTVTINDNGTTTIGSDDVVLYTPTSTTFTGTDSFTYTITDGQGSTDSATVSVTVQQNQSPIANNDTTTILATGSATIDVLANDSDPNGAGDTLSVIDVGGQSNTAAGSVTVTNGNVIYTSAGTSGTFTATDSFTYTIRDLSGNTSTASVSLTVGGPVPPVANDDSVTITQSTTSTLSAGLTSNDSDPNGDTFSIVGVGTPANGGTASLDAGQVIYTATSTAGTDTFTYSIADGTGTDAATVTVSVIAGSTTPVANNDYAIAITSTAVTIPVLLSDSDPNGDTLSITGVTTGTTNGTASIFDNGTTISSDDQIVYTGNTAGVTDTFTYTITDGNSGTSTATVSVGVFADTAGTARAITGDANNNVLVGSDGTAVNEELNGGSGNDILIGRGGGDQLTGNLGADEFRFLAATDSGTNGQIDIISDFDPSTELDTIRIVFESNSTNVSATSLGSGLFNLTISGTTFNLTIQTDPAITDTNSILNAIQYGS